jgi:hypothetical protein
MSTARRRLEDLYVLGKEITFDDGAGEPVTVWLQKLNPVELSTSLRRANAARSRVRTVRNDPTSDEYQAYWLEVLDFESPEQLAEYLAGERSIRAQEREEARLGAEEEWDKDGYLQGLRDAWVNGMGEAHLLEPDEESQRVLDELNRFAEAATLAAADEVASIRAEFESWTLEALREEAMERVIAYHSNAAWLDEFHRCELWRGVRDPANHSRYYFDKREEINNLSATVVNRLSSEYAELSVDVVEGKGSEETPSSSSSSAPADEAGTAVSSGLVTVGP